MSDLKRYSPHRRSYEEGIPAAPGKRMRVEKNAHSAITIRM